MKKIALAVSGLMLAATVAMAANDPIATRKALMDANGAAAGVSAAMLKGDLDYNPAVAKSAIMTLRAVSHSYGTFFPEGSDKGDTKASPKIWSDHAGFEAELAKFQADADAAAKAAGKDGPADLDAFKAAVTPVFNHCKTCHQDYRLK
ncbi:c-type cytochrome [Mesorhizobium koreense]|jgi:cytochrome c556|uniref:c-type cytochrome n=1 Tax=Mesorhizobium koreense TaxID=3074855 RepID=UPI00287B90D2|nr:cytochrome c [Mesorhizobium sp. WR6]